MTSRYIISETHNPYGNIAVEAYLTQETNPGEMILYLWQNEHTVVIGRNQNPYKECMAAKLTADGGSLARRLSGGGAVFHDLGNLNFSFISSEENHDVPRQLGVIIAALKSFGVDAAYGGRNDITVKKADGAGGKVSGNAFFALGGNRCHHGAVLVNTDITLMARYLSAPGAKITGRGVESVRSRVTNLHDVNPAITPESLSDAIIRAFATEYGGPSRIDRHNLDDGEVTRLTEKLRSREWLYGRNLDFTWEAEARYPWGGVTLQLVVEKGVVVDAIAFSDALDAGFIQTLPEAFRGAAFNKAALTEAARALQNPCAADIIDLINEHM